MNTKPDTEWTKPYYGVQHAFRNGHQCTITQYTPTMVTATVFGRYGSGCVFSDARDAPESFRSVEAAQQWCEKEAMR